jgi:hypothetical protein
LTWQVTKTGRTAAIIKWVVAAMVITTVSVFLVDVFDGPVYSLSTRSWGPELHGSKRIGGVQGLVKTVDTNTSTVRISSGFLGLRSLPVVVTPETTIAVDGKLGWLGDLDRGRSVRVTYEMLSERLFASRIQMLDQGLEHHTALPGNKDRDAAMVADDASIEKVAQSIVAAVAERSASGATMPPSASATPSATPWTAVSPPATRPRPSPRVAHEPRRSTSSAAKTVRRARPAAPPHSARKQEGIRQTRPSDTVSASPSENAGKAAPGTRTSRASD